MNKDFINVVVGGEAGQGLVTIGQILAKIFYALRLLDRSDPELPESGRGGHNTYNIRVSPNEIQAPREPIDLLIALDMESIRLHRSELSPSGWILSDQAFAVQGVRCVCVPFSELSPKRYFNIAALGVAAAMLGLDLQVARQALEEFLARRPTGNDRWESQGLSETAVAWEEKNGEDQLKVCPGDPHRFKNLDQWQ